MPFHQLASDEMAYDIRHYIHCLQHDHSWVGRIKNDINKLLVNREYIEFFIQIYKQWSSDNSNKCLPHFEEMTLSQFKVYIEPGKTTQYIVCNNCNMSIFIPYSNVKEGVFCILQILRIYTGLSKWTKKDWYHIILRDMNPLGINQPCLTITNNEVLFEIYRIDLKRYKDAIDIDGEDAINCNRLFFDFMLRMFDHLNQLYGMEKSLLIDAILTYHLRIERDKENLS